VLAPPKAFLREPTAAAGPIKHRLYVAKQPLIKAAEPPNSPGRFVRSRRLTVAQELPAQAAVGRFGTRPRWAGLKHKGKETPMSQPAHKIRIGNLSVTIWRNTSIEKGTTWYTVNPSRSYKNGDETWKESDSLGFDDLLIMAELLRQAFNWIARQQQADFKARKARQEANTAAD
jgi:hypothetical protein